MKGIAVCLVLASCLAPDFAAESPEADVDLETQVQAYMREHADVGRDDAISRIHLQREIAPDLAALQNEFAGRLADVSLKHAPDMHIQVDLKGDAPVAPRLLRAASGTVRVVFRVGRTYTREEFSRVRQRHEDLIYSLIPGITGIAGFPGENMIRIYVEGGEESGRQLKPAITRIERVTGFKVELQPDSPRRSSR